MHKAWVLLLLLAASATVPFLAGTRPGLEGYPTLSPFGSRYLSLPPWGREKGISGDYLFGSTLGPLGDVNGDGYDDMFVLSAFSIYLYTGSSEGPSGLPVDLWHPPDFLPASLAALGDINGDGYDDVVVSFQLTGKRRESRVHLFHGTPDGLVLDPGWTVETEGNTASYLYPTAAGDVNGDGRPDLALLSWAEGVRLHTELGAEPVWHADGRYATATGDANGDGFSDLAVRQDDGRYRVYFGSQAGPPREPSWLSPVATTLASADLNGDGYSDMALAAKRRVLIYYGGPNGPRTQPDRVIRMGLLGATELDVYAAGDLDGDEYEDLAVGIGEKRVLIFEGSPKGLSIWPIWSGRNRDGDRFQWGRGWSGVGDINGDGYADLALGFPDNHSTGQVVLYLGSPAGLPGTGLMRLITAVGLLFVPISVWLLVQGVRLYKQTVWPLLTGIGTVGWLVFLAWLL